MAEKHDLMAIIRERAPDVDGERDETVIVRVVDSTRCEFALEGIPNTIVERLRISG
jgi:hypothetical protein